MKVAVLILAHKNLHQLELLIDSLRSDFDIYVHADKKWNIPINELNSKYGNVHFFSKYDVSWGSSNIMLATIELLKAAYQKQHDYFIFISGQDLPIRTNENIMKVLTNLNGASLIKYQKLPRAKWDLSGGFDRMYYYWEHDFNSPIAKFAMKVVRKFQRIFGLKRKLYPMPAYYGHSMWLTLHNDAVKYVLEFLEKNPGYVKRMKYTTLIDEIWLGTIVLNSPVKVINDQSTHVNWTDGPEYPRTLRGGDYEPIIEVFRNTNCLFARKFDEKVDSNIIQTFLNNRI
ncbi:hypothetical protein D0T53_03945 [Dysgonomonas sp. 216]|uniref:beta-1,6-N-acetylglucosaminyltransferase n=1 Tax=Dysgonomonas sp. 216 TaxID=2302934 RepID=UPI0013D4E1F1|nr:beta-1,6-N-acetylglucosaminyltransferase [Dysgonomonas sp. 216]NDW18069.1 hypothetical protein [Dysgonomonas sp. 216]